MKSIIIKDVQYSVFSIEQLQETVKNSDFEHIQISGGAFSGKNLQIELPNSFVSTGFYNQTILVKGSLPMTMLTFGFILDDIASGFLLGHSFKKGDLLILPENAELHYLIPPHTQWISFNIHRHILEENGIDIPCNQYFRMRSIPSEFNALLTIMRQLIVNKDEIIGEDVEDRLIDIIREIIFSDEALNLRAQKISIPTKANIIKQAQEYLAEYSNVPIKVNQIINELNCSHRTVNYTFKEAFGLTLQQYIKITKLNQLNYILQDHENKNKTIVELAKLCGISHMGRLAQEYRALFNEYPKDTFNRIKQS